MKKTGTAIILCGGKSSRMGFDKSKYEINGKLLIEICAEKLGSVFEEVLLVTKDTDKFKKLRYKIIGDDADDYAPVLGIYKGLLEAGSHFSFIIACDMPVISLNYINYLTEKLEKSSFPQDGLISMNGSFIEPFHSFYSKSMLEKIKYNISIKDYKISNFIKMCNVEFINSETIKKYTGNTDIFTNLNYPCDLEIFSGAFIKELSPNDKKY